MADTYKAATGSSLDCVWAFDRVLTGTNRSVIEDIAGKSVVDIGGVDADLSFFLERSGAARVDFIARSSNIQKTALLFKRELRSSVNILHGVPLSGHYDLAICMGASLDDVEKIARHATFALMSIESKDGLLHLIHLAGWDILDYAILDGDMGFCYLRSRALSRPIHDEC